uniref:Hepatocyte growth factor-regulated tyrosine kinase substrate n=1 Tax=Setaria digitata TaxID=48799 RepID=A0A915PHA4_9BILA
MAKRFERQLDKATDSTLIDPNWDAIIECVDLIRGGEVPVKAAAAAIRKRYHNDNPHVAHHALLVLEACMKNCGVKFHAEIATRDFMEDLKNLSLDTTPDKVKNKILELLQCWALAFKNKPEYKIVVDTHNLMKLAGFDFPHVAEADAMFIAESAPEWADGDECFRCRTAFGIITRKHHCRACGQIFCDKCSSKQSFLPQYGIEKQVRVCDGCYEKTIAKKTDASCSPNPVPLSSKADKSLAVDARKTAEQRARELKQAEEDEINLAIALSQSEAEAQERERQRRLYELYNGTDIVNGIKTNETPYDGELNKSVYKGAAASVGTDTPVSSGVAYVDPELARYLNRDYWQQRKNEQRNVTATVAVFSSDDHQKIPTPTAPPPSESSRCAQSHDRDGTVSLAAPSFASTTKQLEGDATAASHFISTEEEETAETMEFCRQLVEQVTVMDNRIRSNVARNRSVVNDTAIQSLFIRLTEMHAQVMARMNKLEDQRNHFESLQDSLAHIQEARQAVDALREDHERQKQARIMEEQRIKQIQMQQKVDLMRQKKHEMILHQRQMALLRFQQQEQEMQMKRMQMMGQSVQINPISAEIPYSQVVTEHSQPSMHGTNVPSGYPPVTYVDQAHVNYGVPVTETAQRYPPGAHLMQDCVATVKQDSNITNYTPIQPYGDQVSLDTQRQQGQQQFFKSDVCASNYKLNVVQNPVQLLGINNTPAYSLSSVQSPIAQAYPGYQQPSEQPSVTLPSGQQQQLQTIVASVGQQKLGAQEQQPVYLVSDIPPATMSAALTQHVNRMMHPFPSYAPSKGIMEQPGQNMRYPVQLQTNAEPQPLPAVQPAEELLISFD